MMGGCVIWFEFDSAAIFLFPAPPYPFGSGQEKPGGRGVLLQAVLKSLVLSEPLLWPGACCRLPPRHRNSKRERKFQPNPNKRVRNSDLSRSLDCRIPPLV